MSGQVAWEEVTREEYEEVFKTIRQLIEKIEKDQRLGYKGFELKQELREVVRSLIKIEKKIFT
jgi:predicted nucleotide-binding protein (sugar kinase/HSP70/actin superfamily)